MTCTNQQVKLLMKSKHQSKLETAAAKAGMSTKTVRKYLKSGKLPQSDKDLRMGVSEIDMRILIYLV